mmetsp:Transcript_3748/g.13871  ORF Transcript_3748/g.13871 Transcript_3748/m.13871 type:complete len:1104 (-) Transcript_3748:185-3496(-)
MMSSKRVRRGSDSSELASSGEESEDSVVSIQSASDTEVAAGGGAGGGGDAAMGGSGERTFRFVGKPLRGRSNYFRGFQCDDKIVLVGNAVHLTPAPGVLPYLAILESVWQRDDGSMFMNVRWFYRLGDTGADAPPAEKDAAEPDHGTVYGNEVYLSPQEDENPIESFLEPAYVRFLPSPHQRQLMSVVGANGRPTEEAADKWAATMTSHLPSHVTGKPTYFCRFTYDAARRAGPFRRVQSNQANKLQRAADADGITKYYEYVADLRKGGGKDEKAKLLADMQRSWEGKPPPEPVYPSDAARVKGKKASKKGGSRKRSREASVSGASDGDDSERASGDVSDAEGSASRSEGGDASEDVDPDERHGSRRSGESVGSASGSDNGVSVDDVDDDDGGSDSGDDDDDVTNGDDGSDGDGSGSPGTSSGERQSEAASAVTARMRFPNTRPQRIGPEFQVQDLPSPKEHFSRSTHALVPSKDDRPVAPAAAAGGARFDEVGQEYRWHPSASSRVSNVDIAAYLRMARRHGVVPVVGMRVVLDHPTTHDRCAAHIVGGDDINHIVVRFADGAAHRAPWSACDFGSDMAAVSTERALEKLYQCDCDPARALKELRAELPAAAPVDSPQSSRMAGWTAADDDAFFKGWNLHHKNFAALRKGYLPDKSAKDIVNFYYSQKQDARQFRAVIGQLDPMLKLPKPVSDGADARSLATSAGTSAVEGAPVGHPTEKADLASRAAASATTASSGDVAALQLAASGGAGAGRNASAAGAAGKPQPAATGDEALSSGPTAAAGGAGGPASAGLASLAAFADPPPAETADGAGGKAPDRAQSPGSDAPQHRRLLRSEADSNSLLLKCSVCERRQFGESLVRCVRYSCRRIVCPGCFRRNAHLYRGRARGGTFKSAFLNPFWLCARCLPPTKVSTRFDAHAVDADGRPVRRSRREQTANSTRASLGLQDSRSMSSPRMLSRKVQKKIGHHSHHKRGRSRSTGRDAKRSRRSSSLVGAGADGGDGVAEDFLREVSGTVSTKKFKKFLKTLIKYRTGAYPVPVVVYKVRKLFRREPPRLLIRFRKWVPQELHNDLLEGTTAEAYLMRQFGYVKLPDGSIVPKDSV